MRIRNRPSQIFETLSRLVLFRSQHRLQCSDAEFALGGMLGDEPLSALMYRDIPAHGITSEELDLQIRLAFTGVDKEPPVFVTKATYNFFYLFQFHGLYPSNLHTISNGPKSIPKTVLFFGSDQNPNVHFNHFHPRSGRQPLSLRFIWVSVSHFICNLAALQHHVDKCLIE